MKQQNKNYLLLDILNIALTLLVAVSLDAGIFQTHWMGTLSFVLCIVSLFLVSIAWFLYSDRLAQFETKANPQGSYLLSDGKMYAVSVVKTEGDFVTLKLVKVGHVDVQQAPEAK